jgi:hypothetical protein
MSKIAETITQATTYEIKRRKASDYDHYAALLLVFNLDPSNTEKLAQRLRVSPADFEAFKRVLLRFNNL